MMEIVTRTRKCAHKKSASTAALVLYGRDMTIHILPNCPAAGGLVFLQKVAAIDTMPVYRKDQFFEKVRREFDISFARAEKFVEAIIGLRFAGMSVVSEVCGQPFADQRASL